MHFFYLNGAGRKFRDIRNVEDPIFMPGGFIREKNGWISR